MPQTLTKPVAITGVLQEVIFPGNLEFCRFVNNGPMNIIVYDHGGQVLAMAWPGDAWPHDFGSSDYNRLQMLGDAAALAADIAAGNILYIQYQLKRRED